METAKIRRTNPLRRLLGLGFFVQGFRCFPWTAINFFLKDTLAVPPSTLQLLQHSANIPMVAKPLFGLLSDAVYFSGEHRIPYISFGVLLQALSWLSIAMLPGKALSVVSILVLLVLGNIGSSVVEVANDALVAESSKTSSGIQSFVLMMASLGGVFGNLFGGIAMDYFTPSIIFLCFAILLVLQLLFTNSIHERSLNLPKSSSSRSGIRNQLSDVSKALRNPTLARAITWFAASYAVIPILLGNMFYYQTQQLELSSSILGLSKVFGQAAMLLWSASYNRWFQKFSPRKLIAVLQVVIAVFMLSDALFVKDLYRAIGVSDSFYVVAISGLQEALFQFKVLPFVVLVADLCPPGCEGSVMAFLMSAIALASIISGFLGVALASALGVSAYDFSRFPLAILVQAACTLVPLIWVYWIPDRSKQDKEQ